MSAHRHPSADHVGYRDRLERAHWREFGGSQISRHGNHGRRCPKRALACRSGQAVPPHEPSSLRRWALMSCPDASPTQKVSMTKESEHPHHTERTLPAGSIPALVTPMHEDGSLDWQSYRALVDWHVEAGTDAIVVMGSTGEAATVSMEEHRDLIQAAVSHARGRIPIIAGTGANSTSEAIELTQFARDAGVTAALSVVPCYNKPTQGGLFAHYKAVAEAVDIPLILYNVPGRTIADLSNETVFRLAEIPNIAGIKDATGDIGRGIMLMRSLPASFAVYSGDDPTAAALMLHGAQGNISVTANVIPTIMSQLCRAA